MIPHLHLLYLITQIWKSQLPASIFYSHMNSPQIEPLYVSATLVCRLLFMGWFMAHVTDFPLSIPHVSYLSPSETRSLSYRDPEMDGFSTSVASAWPLAWLVATFLWFLPLSCYLLFSIQPPSHSVQRQETLPGICSQAIRDLTGLSKGQNPCSSLQAPRGLLLLLMLLPRL